MHPVHIHMRPTCSTVASTSRVSVVVMVCSAMRCSLPTLTGPICTQAHRNTMTHVHGCSQERAGMPSATGRKGLEHPRLMHEIIVAASILTVGWIAAPQPVQFNFHADYPRQLCVWGAAWSGGCSRSTWVSTTSAPSSGSQSWDPQSPQPPVRTAQHRRPNTLRRSDSSSGGTAASCGRIDWPAVTRCATSNALTLTGAWRAPSMGRPRLCKRGSPR